MIAISILQLIFYTVEIDLDYGYIFIIYNKDGFKFWCMIIIMSAFIRYII